MEPRERARHEELAELAGLAPLQGLAAEEQRRLVDHLAEGCDSCALRYREGVAALDVLALAAPDATPTPGRRETLLAAIAPDAAAPSARAFQRAQRRAVFAALAAGVALAIAAGALLTALRVERGALEGIRLARSQLDARLASGDRQLAGLDARLARFERAIEASGGLRIRELPLDATSASLSASARVMVDPAGSQVLLLASRLPPAPPGHTYQLWVIEDGAPRSVGVFDPDEGGRVLHVESAPGDLTREFSVAVSVEPSGGLPQPSGPIVLASH